MKAFSSVFMMVVLVVAAIPALTGCGGGGQQSEAPAEPKLGVKVVQVDQYRQLDDTMPDGQYMVLTLDLENKSAETMTVSPADFEIRQESASADDGYTQENEHGLGGAFSHIYGRENGDRLLENIATTVHPKRSVQRFIIYMLPLDALPEKFQLVYKPDSLAVPFVATDTKVNDYRSASDTASEISPEEETGEETTEETGEENTGEESADDQ